LLKLLNVYPLPHHLHPAGMLVSTNCVDLRMWKQTRYILFLLPLIYQLAKAQTGAEDQIHQLLSAWHQKAAVADSSYFDDLSEDAVYIGTDAKERWSKKDFIRYAMPYFRKGKAWNFKAAERNIILHPTGQSAWADELLDTWMGPCRATALLLKSEKGWKIVHYQLSVAVPNELMKDYLALKNRSGGQSQAEEVVERQLKAYNQRDLSAFLETFADTATLYRLGQPLPVANGKEELAKLYGAMFEKSPGLNSTLISRTVIGNKVFDHERITGREGNSQILELMMIYEVVDGEIVRAYSVREIEN
jgi:hypothetical protein